MHWTEKLTKKDQKHMKLLLKSASEYRNIAKKDDEAMMQMWVCLIRLYENQVLLEKKINHLMGKKKKIKTDGCKPKILNDLMKY
ncbi:MAG: hypothetical protein KAR87_02250 [Candidatus Aenigmarchaeota archaeon]|nr:hypothetical protein [Candidatus Aenigmarchaeota archaeon]MCK5177069.1 hypothetical protein [Candidatus Aenigmarchaeota archaeon]